MRRAIVAALRHAALSTTDHVAAFSSRAGLEATRSITRPSAAAIAAGLGGAALLSYGITVSRPAHAEATALAAVHTPAPATTTDADSRYALPSDLRGLPKDIVLYQYEVCPFCNKVRAFLDYHNLPYRCVEVNPLTKAELKWSNYKKVPVILLDGKEQFNDSSLIISRLAAELQSQGKAAQQAGASSPKSWFSRSSTPSSSAKTQPQPPAAAAAAAEREMQWRKWVDDWFVRVITVNIYRTTKESFQTFEYITEAGNFKWWEREAARIFGAGLMWGISGRLKRKYGVEGDVRQVLFDSANEWADAVGAQRFLGGEAPDLADLAVFGVLRSVTGTDTFMDVMHGTRIGPWYERMMSAVGDSSRIVEK